MRAKRSLLVTFAGLAFSLLLFFGISTTAFAKEEITTMATTANLNLRDAPGKHGNVITVIPDGTSVEVFSMTAAGWYNVKYKDQTGYAYYVYLNFEGTDKGTVNDGKVTHMYTTAPLNVRAEAGTHAKILGSFAKDEAVEIISKHDGWFKVKYGKQEGYCHGGYLNFGQGETEEATLSQSTMNQLTVTAPLNVRDLPGTHGRIIGSFKKGDTVKVLGQEGDWLKVAYKSTTGYCHSNYIR